MFPKPPLSRCLIVLLLPFAIVRARLLCRSVLAEIDDARRMWRGEWT